MAETLRIKGHDYTPLTIKDSYDRRAVQFHNHIINTLGALGLGEDDIDVPLEPSGFRKYPAAATWYLEGHLLYYSFNKCGKFVENMYMVFKVIEYEVFLLVSGQQTMTEFIEKFSEEEDIEALRKDARDTLGLHHDVDDMEVINKAYKELAKEHHPDMPSGNVETFKKISRAHKLLQRELM
ncbi:MAG: J domain-containing protein [Nanoarchaeota archaeon]